MPSGNSSSNFFNSLLQTGGTTLLFVLAGISALLAVAWAIRTFRKRPFTFSPSRKITSPAVIRNVLKEACGQMRPFEIQLASNHNSSRPTLKCSVVLLAKNSMTVNAIGSKNLAKQLIGRTINVFFRITTKGEFSYHTFTAVIQEAIDRGDTCDVSFPLPDIIENRQQRSFLRITPPLNLVYGAALWHGDSMPQPSQINDLSQWPAPSLFHMPTYLKQFTIADLSAGGMLLQFASQIIKQNSLKLSTLDRFIIMLDLYDPEKNKRLRLWLHCRAQRLSLEPPDLAVHLGAKFLAWGKPRTADSPAVTPGAIEWFRLPSTQEVEPIGNWIMRRHINMFTPLDTSETAQPTAAPALDKSSV